MADSTTSRSSRRCRQRGPRRGLPWMNDRQLDAYFQTRETLRRVDAIARLAAAPSREAPQDVSG